MHVVMEVLIVKLSVQLEVVITLTLLWLMLLMLSIVTGRKLKVLVGLVDLEAQLCSSTLIQVSTFFNLPLHFNLVV